jgi:hypothetical protein
MIRTYPELINY